MTSISDATQCAIERRPTKMLKEFLKDDDHSSSNSCSSSDPTHPPPPASLRRSRSRSRDAVSSFQKLLTSAMKSLHRISPSSSSSSPATLQRSLSKRMLTKFRRSKKPNAEKKAMKVKDILRWRSFRDEDSKSRPSDSPANSAVTTTTSRGENSDFSFTAEELPRRCEEGKKWKEDEVDVDVDDADDGGDLVRETIGAMDVPGMGQGQQQEDDVELEEDKEQHSPVSVLNSPFRDEISDEEVAASFDQSLANVERTKLRLLQSIQWLENLAGVDGQDDDFETEDQEDEEKDREAELTEEKTTEAGSRTHMFKVLGRLTREGQGFKSKDCIKDIEREGQWTKFEEEKEEVLVELESCLLHDLVDEVLVDLFGQRRENKRCCFLVHRKEKRSVTS